MFISKGYLQKKQDHVGIFQGGDHDPQNLMSSYKTREDPAKPYVDNFDTICREVDNDKNR